jgi:hypothetical protein
MQDGGPATADWEIAGPADAIVRGASRAGFSVTLSAEDEAYEHGHWTAYLDTDEEIAYSGTLRRAQ